jgi:hypothetical protein
LKVLRVSKDLLWIWKVQCPPPSQELQSGTFADTAGDKRPGDFVVGTDRLSCSEQPRSHIPTAG